MLINERFNNKVAVVTGGADGIGRGVACRLGKEGARLALFDINNELLQKTVEEFASLGIESKGYVVDISSESQVSEAIEQVEKDYQKIDILINAGGIVGPTNTKITEFATTDFDKIYEVNLKGTFLITKFTLKAMKKTGKGRLLLIASIAGRKVIREW